MFKVTGINWAKVLYPDTPLIEIFARGTLVYLALFLMLRFVLKRQSGVVGVTDMLVVVLIADAAQNAMAAEYTSVTDGVLLVGTILFWSYALDWLGYKSPKLERLLRPPPLPLVKNGRMIRRNMRMELITEDELLSMLRQQGIESIEKVKTVCMEGDGHISVVPCKSEAKSHRPSERRIF
ncbi:MAG TPA: YetF domain-containing protein [Isosphaeraceae bacterium]